MCGGVSVVVRDETGSCVAAFARSFSPVLSALQMETEACRAALLIAVQQGWSDIDLESDCSLVITTLANSTEDWSDICLVMEDCRDYMCESQSLNVRHIFCETNGVAHKLAYFTSVSFIDDVWLGETPCIIKDVLFEDLCNYNRGTGPSSPQITLMSSLINNPILL